MARPTSKEQKRLNRHINRICSQVDLGTMTQYLDKSTGKYHGPLDNAGLACIAGTGGIDAGEFVYIDSYSSGTPVVLPADASDATKCQDVYFCPEAIAAAASGYMFTSGTLTGNTAAMTADDPVYLSDSTPGAWTKDKPTGTDIVKIIGTAVTAAASGTINVNTGDESIIAHDHSDAANGGDLAATGGTIDGVVIGGSTPAAIDGTTITGTTLTDGTASLSSGTFSGIADLGIVTTADIDGGSLDGVTIGAATPAAVTGTDFTGNTVTISGSATIEHPIDMNSVAAMTGDSTTDNGNVIKISRESGAIGGTHSGIICKHYITGGAVDGTGLVSGLYVNLKYEPDSENAAAEVSLMQTHLYSDASDAIDYGWYCLAPDSKISALLGVSGDMASFMEVKASGNGGFTVSADGMTKNPESDTEDAYLTINVEGGASYQIPAYTA